MEHHVSSAKQIKARGWYLEHHDGGHFKFYTVIITETGVLVTHYGRIGTTGQASIDQLSPNTAQSNGIRKVHEKVSKGYEYKHEDVTFALDDRDIQGALGVGREKPDPKRLTMLFDRACRDPKFTGEKDSVLGVYDIFIAKAEGIMDRTATHSFESVMNDFEELKVAWTEIGERHDRAGTTIDLTSKMVAQALMSGKLA